jgi:hypothetical protein
VTAVPTAATRRIADRRISNGFRDANGWMHRMVPWWRVMIMVMMMVVMMMMLDIIGGKGGDAP